MYLKKKSYLVLLLIFSLSSCTDYDDLPDSIVYKPSEENQKITYSLYREHKVVSFDTSTVIEKLCWEFVCFSNEIEILDAYYTVSQSFDSDQIEPMKTFIDTNSVVLFVAVSKNNDDVEYWNVHCDLEEGGMTYKISKRDSDTMKIYDN